MSSRSRNPLSGLTNPKEPDELAADASSLDALDDVALQQQEDEDGGDRLLRRRTAHDRGLCEVRYDLKATCAVQVSRFADDQGPRKAFQLAMNLSAATAAKCRSNWDDDAPVYRRSRLAVEAPGLLDLGRENQVSADRKRRAAKAWRFTGTTRPPKC